MKPVSRMQKYLTPFSTPLKNSRIMVLTRDSK